MILFSILVVIQFVVITQGATRISEVAARFMLDGLPGRQMAIDADLHAGLIDQHEAHRRREAVYRQADFFGAMDGAGKFVRGDAVAGVVIMLVNIGGGLFLGIVNHGMSLGEAVNVFTKLTIGDGLVSQVPAFLISLAAGLIVTRSSSSTDLGRDVVGQLFSQPGRAGDRRGVPGPAGAHPAAQAAAADPGRRTGRRRDLLAACAADGDRLDEPTRPARSSRADRGSFARPVRRTGRCGRRREPDRRTSPQPAASARSTPARTGWKTCSTSIRSSWRSATG